MDREGCHNCPALVVGENDEWICDYSDKEIERVDYCPEYGVSTLDSIETSFTVEIYATDLKDECREQLKEFGVEFNDIAPIVILRFKDGVMV